LTALQQSVGAASGKAFMRSCGRRKRRQTAVLFALDVL